MGLRLVDDDLDISIDLDLDPDARAAVAVQLQRVAESAYRSSFEGRLAQTLQDLLDADLQPPSYKQLSYAMAIAKTLGVAIPGEAMAFKGSMGAFLSRHAPLFQDRRRSITDALRSDDE
jgi:hypothetical protein